MNDGPLPQAAAIHVQDVNGAVNVLSASPGAQQHVTQSISTDTDERVSQLLAAIRETMPVLDLAEPERLVVLLDEADSATTAKDVGRMRTALLQIADFLKLTTSGATGVVLATKALELVAAMGG